MYKTTKVNDKTKIASNAVIIFLFNFNSILIEPKLIFDVKNIRNIKLVAMHVVKINELYIVEVVPAKGDIAIAGM